MAMLIPGPSCTGNHQSYFPVLGSPLEGALLGRAVWEPVCGSQVLSETGVGGGCVPGLLIKNLECIFPRKKYYAERIHLCDVCESTLQAIKNYVICLKEVTILQYICAIIPTLCGLNSLL